MKRELLSENQPNRKTNEQKSQSLVVGMAEL